MKKGITNFLTCPTCSGNLTLQVEKRNGKEIISGLLICTQEHRFPIKDGVPRFIDHLTPVEFRTQEVFGKEWTTFSVYDASNLARMATDLPQSFFSDKLVLDAGCGGGRHAVELNNTWKAKTVIGVDVSDSVTTANERTREVDDIHIVQAGIHRLPFANNYFDIVFCLGVLQHLSKPQRAFSYLVYHLKPGGRIVIWVYKRSLRKRLLEIPRIITKRLPIALQQITSFAVSIISYPLVLIQRYLRVPLPSHFKEYAKYDWSTYRTDWFDRLSAPITNYYEEDEIGDWFTGESLEDIQVSSYGDFFIRGIGTKSE